MSNLSVIILTFNEEIHIKRCIESLQPFAKNVYIIDSYSTDNTVKIAKSVGAHVYQNRWPGNHASQFQWGLDNCPIGTEWVMKMDADEYVLPELSAEINAKINSIPKSVSGIYIKRRVFFMGRWMKHGGYYPTWLLRIWRYEKGRVEQRLMDEHIKLSSGDVAHFESDFVDDNKKNLTWWIEKHNNYSIREAADVLNTLYGFTKCDEIEPFFLGTQEQRKRWLKTRYVSLPLFFRPILYFVWRYFVKFGFLDGKQGLVWHVLQGFWYRFLVDAKINEVYLKAGKDKNAVLKYLRIEHKIEL